MVHHWWTLSTHVLFLLFFNDILVIFIVILVKLLTILFLAFIGWFMDGYFLFLFRTRQVGFLFLFFIAYPSSLRTAIPTTENIEAFTGFLFGCFNMLLINNSLFFQPFSRCSILLSFLLTLLLLDIFGFFVQYFTVWSPIGASLFLCGEGTLFLWLRFVCLICGRWLDVLLLILLLLFWTLIFE